MASAKQKQAMLAKELAGQPDIADENDNATPTVNVAVREGELEAFIRSRAEDGEVEELDEVRSHELDKEIEAAQRKLRALKMRKAGGYKTKLQPGQELVLGKDNRMYVKEEMVGENGTTVTRVSCIEYEPN